MNRSTFVFFPSALTQCCPSISRYQRKRVTWSSVAKFFSALRALGLQKQNFLRAARARYQRKRVTQSSVAKFFSALRAPVLQKPNFLRAARAIYFLQVFRRSTIVFSANAWLSHRVFKVSADPVVRQVHAAHAKVAKAKFSPRCTCAPDTEETGDPAWRRQHFFTCCARQIPEKMGDPV